MITCWTGPSSPFELRLLQPMATYALEQLRQRFLYVLTDDHVPLLSARVLLQTAFETEIGVALGKLIALPAGVATSNVCSRRRFLDIDRDMRQQRYLIQPALDDLAAAPNVPTSYVDFVRRYLVADYARYRTCALSATICLAKAIQ